MGGVKRIAIIFNGSLPDKDLVAAIDRSFVRAMQPILLDEEHFDSVYRLDDECKTKDVRLEVFCFPPTLKSLEAVTADINSKFGNAEAVSVFTYVEGHGSSSHEIPTQNGLINGRDFAKVLGRLQPKFQRVTDLHMCYAGGYATFGLVDDNDLLKAYAGKDETNWSDAAGIAVLQRHVDPNKDGIVTTQESFWLGQSYIYNEFAPYRRRFVFQRGKNFIDRGLGTKAATPPFPASLVEVKEVMSYLKLAKSGASQGITVIGFEGENGGGALKKKMEEAAAAEGGFAQFLWVPKLIAFRMARPADATRLRKESLYKFFYHGANESLSFIADQNPLELLKKSYASEKIDGEKK